MALGQSTQAPEVPVLFLNASLELDQPRREPKASQDDATQKSILDFIANDAKAMHRRLGRNDQQKLDEYLTGVREIERQIQKTESFGNPIDPGVASPKGVPQLQGSHEVTHGHDGFGFPDG